MRKVVIVALSVVGVSYFLLAEVGDLGDEPVSTTPQPFAKSGTRPGDPPRTIISTLSDNLADDLANDLAEPGDPVRAVALRAPETAFPRNETATPSDRYIAPPPTNERKLATIADRDERTAALWQLADHNMEKFSAVLWYPLEGAEGADTDFGKFVQATLDARGDHAPGAVLAALVQTAPTPTLRLSALRLLAGASQELSVQPFNQALDDPDPAIRRSARAFFDELRANALLDAVADAVLDRNRAVRLTAFSTLEEMYEFAPVWEVADLVMDDPDPKIRMRALELLAYGDRQAAIDRLAPALTDPNPNISELAEDLLAELEQDPS